MTDTFQEPYGIAYRGTGSGPNLHPLYDPLPEGVNHITVGTREPSQLHIYAVPDRSRNNLNMLGSIPAGSGYRSITATFSVAAGETWFITVNGTKIFDPDVRASGTVVTIPLRD